MALFAKYVKVYEEKGRKENWKNVRAALKEAGITGLKADIWQDEKPVCGCGAKLDNRDFGPNGRIDRDIYAIRVREEDREAAEAVVRKVLPDYTPYVPNPDRIH